VDFLLALIEVFSLGVTAESLRAKRSKIGASLQRGHFDPKFQVERVAPHQLFLHRLVRPMNALQLCRWQFSHKKKLCSRLSLSEVRFYAEIGHFAFFEMFILDSLKSA